ncbi:spermidine/putrescine transport system permease protein [Pseudoxanthobacter soli DSM 19599]|uniref:Spermidine/putrescine transport system permease protein n=1 Tax=Pseudoxanthobacter soli DSM 19599 TaxID=1123029 RepID=A0A1M7ZMV8_9HYPH|nr:ABC transporter permease [Pseudoxanthobacter soli]SHO65996.1 spermidine/putrescine transport system permease protein [Pseudoxanthobacter soli DSM 19599]
MADLSFAAPQAGPMRTGVPSRRRQLRRIALALVVYGLPVLLILVPLATFLLYSFWSTADGQLVKSFTLANYIDFLAKPVYRSVFTGTLWLAGIVATTSLIFGYIIAYLIWRLEGRLRYFLLLISVIPLAMNYIVKIYAMRNILGYNGPVNWLLIQIGVLDVPSKAFIYNQTAVMITMAVIYLPYAILPIFLSLERISPSLMAASADLGGRPGPTFVHVVLPLSLPGSIVGALFVMVLALGDYLTPQMVGGNQGFTFGRAIWSQFGMAFNWPFGAALAVVLLVSVVLIILVAAAISRHARVK